MLSFSLGLLVRPIAQDGGGVNEVLVRGDLDVVPVALYQSYGAVIALEECRVIGSHRTVLACLTQDPSETLCVEGLGSLCCPEL